MSDEFKEKRWKELDIALENRAFEIQLFWQRTNYFLVLITALGVGVFAIKNIWLSVPISFFASLSSLLWFRTNLGSKFWQESWEVEVTILAEELGIESFKRSMVDITLQVENAFQSEGKPAFRKWIDKLTVKKPSVTQHMITLSFWSTILWGFISLLYLIQAMGVPLFEGSEAKKEKSPITIQYLNKK
ncbi:MAG: hypothetical protein COB37_03200 [Kordiimonadales bacterium]|nr:MAG: hypothetical protein COB37_03200 [Kordiimonadales bacterium]